MLDDESTSNDQTTEAPAAAPRRRAAGRPAGPPKAAVGADLFSAPAAVEAAPKTKRATKAPVADDVAEGAAPVENAAPVEETIEEPPAKKAAARKRPAAKKAVATAPEESANVESLVDVELVEAEAVEAESVNAEADLVEEVVAFEPDSEPAPAAKKAPVIPGSLMFQAPERVAVPARAKPVVVDEPDASDDEEFSEDGDGDGDGPRRRKRSRGGRRRRKPGTEDGDTDSTTDDGPHVQSGPSDDDDEDGEGGTTRRRRRRVRQGDDTNGGSDDPHNTVVRVREGRTAEDEITSVSGSTRLEAKKQRRREGREAGRRRAPIVSEAEFLARRESVKREMVVRQKDDFSQIAVLEDDVLVEHYVSRESQTSLIGNVYLGRVQNVLPSMEAAFIDIGRGRNAVLYAGEVDWTTLGNGKQRKIEDVLTSGQTVLVQVTKDPIGQKGARLTSQISLAGRFLVYVPG
ncbi:MAG: ribonuclease, partial [Nocardioidaceae bacterium]|nr:ribonuclease [Nocardioidaceae bacterium]